jgi:hypothetical protein
VKKLFAAGAIAVGIALGGASIVDACRAFPEIIEYQVGDWMVSSGCVSWSCGGGCSLWSSVEYNTRNGDLRIYYY